MQQEHESTDESLKDLRLSTIEEAVLNVQGYTTAAEYIEINKLAEMIDNAETVNNR